MQIPVTLINAAGGGAMTQLYDNTASGAIASWDVSGISQAYNHLEIIVNARGDTAATNTGLELRFNNDSAANYDYQHVKGIAALTVAAEFLGLTSAEIGAVSAATATADISGFVKATVSDYASSTFRKQIISQSATQTGVTSGTLSIFNILNAWRSTAAVNRITVFPAAGNFIAGSRLTIYGLL
jgi:hypothetical protein